MDWMRSIAGASSGGHGSLPRDDVDSFLLSHLEFSKKDEGVIEHMYGGTWAICNFTRSEYIISSEPFHSWASDPSGPGQQLLSLLVTSDPLLSWSECELAITPMGFPWMTNVTELAKKLVGARKSDV